MDNDKPQEGMMSELVSLQDGFRGVGRTGTSDFQRSFSIFRRWPRAVAAALVGLFVFSPLQALAASFACDKAQSSVEKMICADPELSALDEKLASAYKQALDASIDKDALRRTQRVWLTRTRNACPDRACLSAAYQARLAQLASNGAGTSSTEATGKAAAGPYVLVKGKGVEVCEAYARNLNSFHPTEPMICERQIDPQLGDFKKPEWSQVTLDQARALEFDMAKLVSRVLNRPEPKSESEVKVRTEKDHDWPAKREIARVDIDNDGTPDLVLKQQDGACPEHRAFSVNIAVLTEDGKHYDLEKSQYVDADRSALVGQLSKDPKPWDRRTAGLSKNDFRGYSLYDIFIYRGVAYFDLWEMGENYPDPRSGRLHVFLHTDKKTQEICTYRFR